MEHPRPLANPFLRRTFLITAMGGAVCTGITVWNAVTGDVYPGWVTALSVAAGWIMALVAMCAGYGIGWHARGLGEVRRSVGQWMAWPADGDGIPEGAPVMGRLVLDEPVGVWREWQVREDTRHSSGEAG